MSDVQSVSLFKEGFPLRAQGTRARVGQSVASQVSLDKEGNEMRIPTQSQISHAWEAANKGKA